MLRSDWTQNQIDEALNYIRANYTFQTSKYPANVKHNKHIFEEINELYENMFCGVLEVYKLINNNYNHPLFCPVCGKRNGFKNSHCSNTCTQLDKNVSDNKSSRQVFCENLYFDGLKDGVVYEFLGDYYHGNPNRLAKYSPETQRRYKEFYNNKFIQTKERFDKIIGLGYKIYYCWESDFNNDNCSYRVYQGKLEY